MSADQPQYSNGRVRLPLENGQTIELTPRECWGLAEKVRRYLVENHRTIEQMPTEVVRKNRRSFNVAVTQSHGFWRAVESGYWEPNTFKIFDRFVTSDTIHLDIGSWIGPTALYAAQLAKRAYAFEPDPVAYQELEANVLANKDAEWASRLAIQQMAIASTVGKMKLGSRGDGGDSMSSSLFVDGKTSWEVETGTLERFVESEKLQNEKLFVKIDIEGGEYELVPSLKSVFPKYNMALFLSLHPFFLMGRLLQGKGNSLRERIEIRLAFAWQQLRLVRALSFRHLYHPDGRPINVWLEISKALFRGAFLTEIVATNKKWGNA